MRDLIGRYHDAVERYLRLKLRDQNLADEVFQEFWTKLLTDKLAGADQNKGRFRDYLRTVLHRLIIDHFRSRKLQPLPPGDLLDPSDPDADFDRVWREAIIKRVWSRLETYEVKPPITATRPSSTCGSTTPTPRSRSSPSSSAQKSGSAVTPEAFRKTLQRARSKFLELLSRSCTRRSTPPSPTTSRRRSSTSVWVTVPAATRPRSTGRPIPSPVRHAASSRSRFRLSSRSLTSFAACENSHGPLTPGFAPCKVIM